MVGVVVEVEEKGVEQVCFGKGLENVFAEYLEHFSQEFYYSHSENTEW